MVPLTSQLRRLPTMPRSVEPVGQEAAGPPAGGGGGGGGGVVPPPPGGVTIVPSPGDATSSPPQAASGMSENPRRSFDSLFMFLNPQRMWLKQHWMLLS